MTTSAPQSLLADAAVLPATSQAGESRPENTTRLMQLGTLCRLRALAGRPIDARLPLWLDNAVLAHTVRVHHDGIGRPVGYVAWADVSKETLLFLARTGRMPRFPYEWKEGHIALLLDVALVDKRSVTVKAMLRRILGRRRAIAFVRHDRVHLLLRKHGRYELIIARLAGAKVSGETP